MGWVVMGWGAKGCLWVGMCGLGCVRVLMGEGAYDLGPSWTRDNVAWGTTVSGRMRFMRHADQRKIR